MIRQSYVELIAMITLKVATPRMHPLDAIAKANQLAFVILQAKPTPVEAVALIARGLIEALA